MRTYVLSLVSLAVLALAACSSGDEADACVRNSQCPSGFVCDGGLCVEACEFDRDCASGEACSNGYCVPGGDMGSDAETDMEPDVPDVGQPTGIGPDGQPVYGANAGETCAEADECRPGLTCTDDACAPAGEGAEGDLCTVAGECGDGLSCTLLARCAASPQLDAGSVCSDSSQCAAGLRCDLVGVTGICQAEGAGDLGQACTGPSECMAPLVCDLTGSCQIPAFSEIPLYQGTECAERDEDAVFRAFFEVPGDDAPAEFFRLPYPNDVRLSSSGVDLSGFPIPDPTTLGGGLIASYVDAIESGGRAFSTVPTIFFRFSREFDFDSISGGGDTPSLVFVNIDPDSEGYGRALGMSWFMTNGRGKYICHNYVAVRSSWNSPLDHDTTFAVYLTTGVQSSGGETPVQDDDFASMLADSDPGDGLTDAWEAYAPLRAYLEEQSIAPATLSAATVFTTMDPDAEVAGIRAGIRGRTVAPVLENVTLCADGVESPCDGIACRNDLDGLLEVHATYRAPVYQDGDRPYLTEGGGVIFDSDGEPESQGAEEICLTMSIPDAPMPEDGWPVVMYAHGTGGSAVSHLSGPAGWVGDIDVGDEDPVQMVSVSIDGVQHGTRRGSSDLDPELLFFNFANPDAAMGNMLQGVADYFYLTWLLEEVDVAAEDSVTGEAITFDDDHFFFMGHSQGSMVGVPFLAHETRVRAAVLSGAGGSLVLSLLNKSNPVDIASSVQFVLNDGEIGDNHPVLNLLQQFIDPVDPLNFANNLFRAPLGDNLPIHTLQTYGLGDTYTPERTQQVLGAAMGIQVADPALQDISGIRGATLPASGNRRTDGFDVTSIMIQFEAAEGRDGHFVMFDHDDAQDQVTHFLGTAVSDGTPTVPATE